MTTGPPAAAGAEAAAAAAAPDAAAGAAEGLAAGAAVAAPLQAAATPATMMMAAAIVFLAFIGHPVEWSMSVPGAKAPPTPVLRPRSVGRFSAATSQSPGRRPTAAGREDVSA